jgi:hypothetical protein
MSSKTTVRRLAVALLVPGLLVAQGRGGRGRGAPGADSSNSGDVVWRNLGPESAGRMVGLAGSVARPSEYYFGTTGGGVWKTTDGGKTAVPVSDRYFGGSIGAIAIDEKNPDIVWSGGGEYAIRGNVSYGDGIWKTTDGAKTWQYMGLRETQQISRIVLDPRNSDVAYVAALGHVWGATPDRGVYKTTDGGRSWRKILFRNDSTGAIELVMDPANPDVLYAALWQAGRNPWLLISGGHGGGIFKTTDGGDHWMEITHNTGLPAGIIGNVGMAISPANPNRVWALIENEPNGGVYRSDDAGATWTLLSQDREIRSGRRTEARHSPVPSAAATTTSCGWRRMIQSVWWWAMTTAPFSPPTAARRPPGSPFPPASSTMSISRTRCRTTFAARNRTPDRYAVPCDRPRRSVAAEVVEAGVADRRLPRRPTRSSTAPPAASPGTWRRTRPIPTSPSAETTAA